MVDRPPQPAHDDDTKAQQRRRLIWRLVGAGLLVLGLLVVLLLACVLWIPRSLYPSLTETDLRGVSDAAKVQELKGARLKLQNDARTTLVQGLGALLVLTGAGIGASVTLRQIRETATANRNQLQLGEQGQVTERYTRAVEQLGHEKAPVRLGALYSLEHLAQDNSQYRQTVVDVVCAYLRMPYTLPTQTERDAEQVEEMALAANGLDQPPHPAAGRDPTREELQVRGTAQRLLTNHLRCPPGTSGQDSQLLPPSPQENFWSGISLDLTGATLVDFYFGQTSVIEAVFDRATFRGTAVFVGATFQENAWFGKAIFQGHAEFTDATFQGTAWFREATFQGDARFNPAIFQGDASFGKATFEGYISLAKATFQGGAMFAWATFQDSAFFNGVTFRGEAGFGKATFQGDAEFAEATFQGSAFFNRATFQDTAQFGKATFQRDARFNGARVVHVDDDHDRGPVWPDGWTVRPDPIDPTRGTLVPAEQTEEPEPAVPSPDETGR